MTNNLTIKEMKNILDNNLIDTCTSEHKQQVMDFAFGADFMASSDKGELVHY
jgi:hypothetical protein